MVNKVKQGKGQVTLCFKCETSASSKTRNVVEKAGIEPASPALAGSFLTMSHQGNTFSIINYNYCAFLS